MDGRGVTCMLRGATWVTICVRPKRESRSTTNSRCFRGARWTAGPRAENRIGTSPKRGGGGGGGEGTGNCGKTLKEETLESPRILEKMGFGGGCWEVFRVFGCKG